MTFSYRSFRPVETENIREREDSGYQNCDKVENSTPILFVANPGYDMIMMNEIGSNHSGDKIEPLDGGKDVVDPTVIDKLTRDDLLDFAKQIANGMVQYRH